MDRDRLSVVSAATTRRVWAAVSAGVRTDAALCQASGIGRTTLHAALRRLEQLGYITRPDYAAIVVVVPFIITGRKDEWTQ